MHLQNQPGCHGGQLLLLRILPRHDGYSSRTREATYFTEYTIVVGCEVSCHVRRPERSSIPVTSSVSEVTLAWSTCEVRMWALQRAFSTLMSNQRTRMCLHSDSEWSRLPIGQTDMSRTVRGLRGDIGLSPGPSNDLPKKCRMLDLTLGVCGGVGCGLGLIVENSSAKFGK